MTSVGLIDYGAGNVTSVHNALCFLGVKVVCITEPQQMNGVSHLILPGVGAFASAMKKLEKMHLIAELRRQLLEIQKPFLGICVGMQVLATLGCEFEEYPGLDIISGTVKRIPCEEQGIRLPHIGWNELQLKRQSPIFRGMSDHPIFYFVHSYQLQPEDQEVVSAISQYGTDIVAVVESENVFGVQFHPEKSQHDGLCLLRNFTNLPSSGAARC